MRLLLKLSLAALCLNSPALRADDCSEDTSVQVQAKAVKADPKNAVNNFNLASAYYNKRCYDDAIDAFEKTVKLVKGQSEEHKAMRFECLSALGGLYYARNDAEGAVKYFKLALEIKSGDKFCLNGISMAYNKLEDSENSLIYLRKTLLADPRNADAHYRLAVLLNKNVEKKLADSGQKLKELEPKELRDLIGAFEDTVRLAEGKSDYKEVLVASYNRLGEIYKDTGQFEKAVSAFTKTTKLAPEDFAAHFLLGRMHYEVKNFAAMTEEYKKAVEIDPSNADARHNLGLAFISQEQFADAYEQFKAITDVDDSNTSALALMGQNLERALDQLNSVGTSMFTAEDYRGALDKFNRVLVLDPRNKTGKEFSQKSSDMLEKQFAKLMKDAATFIKGKKNEDAAEALDKALILKPGDEEAVALRKSVNANTSKLVARLLAQGDLAKASGDYDKAREHWTRAKGIKDGKKKAEAKLASLNKLTGTELAKALKIAGDALKKSDLLKARNAYRDAASIDKKNFEAQNGLVKVNQQLIEKEKALLAKGQKAFDGGDKAGARKAFEEVLKINAKNNEAQTMVKEITGNESKVVVDANKVKDLYYKGVDQYVNNKIKEAISTWEELLKYEKDHQDARKNIERAKAKLRALAQL